MRNGQNRFIAELLFHHLLYQSISLEVNAGSSLIYEYNFFGIQERACDVDELFFTRTQIVSTLGHRRGQPFVMLKFLPNTTQLQCLNNLGISMGISWVNIFFDCPREKEMLLQNDVDVRSKLLKTKSAYICSIDDYFAGMGFDYPQ